MKIKPYRVCDICGNQYEKRDKCMRVGLKVKILKNEMGYDDLPIMEKMDICPHCGKMMLNYLRIKNQERFEPIKKGQGI